ncbi:MAG: 4Fe-4S binding protein [Candidatus Omnitrophota bacterium]|jgi:ferredoxin|nr:4Fe-4S binding protein [Syntrophales bacterium]
MISRKVVLHFPRKLVEQPIVFKLVKDYGLNFNILKAYVTPDEEGLMVLELSGEEPAFEKGLHYLKSCGVKIQPLSQDVVRNEEKCTDCGVCVPLCPAGALLPDKESRKIVFSEDKCIACGVCVRICPFKAMEVRF